jgi:hypothetical protein
MLRAPGTEALSSGKCDARAANQLILQKIRILCRFRQSGLNLDGVGEDLRPLSLAERKEEGFAQKLGLPDPRNTTQDDIYCFNLLKRVLTYKSSTILVVIDTPTVAWRRTG